MLASRTSIIAAVEIGTSKCVALLGEISEDRQLSIIGVGQAPSRGVSKGCVTDLKLASDSTHAAILAAEENAGGGKAESVFLAQTGGHLDGLSSEEQVTVSRSDRVVSRDDIETVTRLAMKRQPPPDNTVVHYVRRQFRLDGKVVANPEFMRGERLSVGYWIAHGKTSIISDHIRIINGFNLRVTDIVLSSLASAAMVATDEEKKLGVLVVDIGSGTSDFVLYRDGCVQATGVIPVGGDHLTNDLSLALRCTQPQAESLKKRCGRADVTCRDRAEKVWITGDKALGDRQVSLQAIQKVTAARTEELFQILRDRLGSLLVPEAVRAGAILTGGTSRLEGIQGVAEQVLGTTVRLGENPDWVKGELKGPEYSTALGLLYYGLLYPGERQRASRPAGLLRRFIDKLSLA